MIQEARRFAARNAVALVTSVGLHVLLGVAIALTPTSEPKARRLAIRVSKVKPPETLKPKLKRDPLKPDQELPPPVKRPKKKKKPIVDLTKKPPPPPKPDQVALKIRPDTPPADPNQPPVRAVTGVTLSSVTGPDGSGGNWSVPIGNTSFAPQPKQEHVPIKDVPIAAPRAAFQVDVMPKLLEQEAVDYPADARRAGVEGRVILNLEIDERGRVTKAKLVKGLFPSLDALALATAKRMRFRPAKAGGESVPVRIRYVYTFELEDSW